MKTVVRALKDFELLHSTKTLVAKEREITTDVLRHLAEIERRKLYCDVTASSGLKYGSLFDYAVHELGYSHGAASRRLAAMRLVKEMPEVEAKIESGALNLTNIARAQDLFRDLRRVEPTRSLSKEEKAAILEKLEQKSSREGEKVILSMTPPDVLPRERVRHVTAEHVEIRFLADAQFQKKLQTLRSLMGPRGADLPLSELMSEMIDLGIERLAEKKFGKRRVQATASNSIAMSHPTLPQTHSLHKPVQAQRPVQSGAGLKAPVLARTALVSKPRTIAQPSADTQTNTHARYIPQAVKHAVWQAAGGRCGACGSQQNLQFDHVQPVALGGISTPDNLQLLCGSCNLRRGVRTYGQRAMRRD